ncbi:MAG: sulfatase-like hydrolase/transferase [Planctomycetes bacterium]|nr:sulfatase-like hydrolase/transferase [Planctomycetota bacterium]
MDARRNATLLLWLANVALGAIIGLSYLEGLGLEASPRLWVFAHLGLVSTIATMSLVPLALVWSLARLGVRPPTRELAQAVIWMLFQIALVIDTRVWGLFRYHFNSAAWNLITSKGSEDSYRLGPRIWIFAFSLGALIALAQWLLWRLLHAPWPRWASVPRLGRWAWGGAGLVLVAIGVEKSIYAKADLEHDASIESVSRALPLYPRLSVSEMLAEPALDGNASLPRFALGREGARLAYPLEVPALAAGGPRPNILILVIDSWRRDMLDEQVTPHLWRFAQGARRFDDHLSGGNGTRFGIFSLLYGLHGSYWWPTLEAQRSPVLLDVLTGSGYEPRVYSSASMDYPEFRRTAWAGILEHVCDDFGERRPSERDELVADACIQWWGERDRQRPFFAFVLLDSAHQKYDFPEEHASFTPYAAEIDYLEMAGSRDAQLVELVRNRYRNAVQHADRVAGRLLDALERSGALDSTLVIVTGDHGEEFAENGYWGHTGNFTAAQVAVPFVMRGPGVAPGVETWPTAHVDVPATLLESLGADRSLRARWSNGGNLLAPSPSRARAVAGWEELGLWTESGIFRIPRELGNTYRASVCDARWRLLRDPRAAFHAQRAVLETLVDECTRFLALDDLAAAESR